MLSPPGPVSWADIDGNSVSIPKPVDAAVDKLCIVGIATPDFNTATFGDGFSEIGGSSLGGADAGWWKKKLDGTEPANFVISFSGAEKGVAFAFCIDGTPGPDPVSAESSGGTGDSDGLGSDTDFLAPPAQTPSGSQAMLLGFFHAEPPDGESTVAAIAPTTVFATRFRDGVPTPPDGNIHVILAYHIQPGAPTTDQVKVNNSITTLYGGRQVVVLSDGLGGGGGAGGLRALLGVGA